MTDYILVSRTTCDDALVLLREHQRLIVDTETTGLHPWTGARVCGVSVTTPDLTGTAYFPVRHQGEVNLYRDQYDALLDLLDHTFFF